MNFITIGKAFIVRPPYSRRIVEGAKTWELRSRPTKIRGTVGIIESGTSSIIGFVDIINSTPVSLDILRANESKHTVSPDALLDFHYDVWYAWELEKAKKLKVPIKIEQKRGSVIWVRVPLRYNLGVTDFEA